MRAYVGSVTTTGDWNGSTVSCGTTFSSTTSSVRWPSTGLVSGSGGGLITMLPAALTMIGKAWPGRMSFGTRSSQRQVMPWFAFLFAGVMLNLGPPTPNWMLTPKTEPLNAVIPPVTSCRRPIVVFWAGLEKNTLIPGIDAPSRR